MTEIYCSSDALGANDGSSWFDAYISLDDAVNAALSDVNIVKVLVDINDYSLSNNIYSKDFNITGGFNPFNKKDVETFTSINIGDVLVIDNTLIIDNCQLTEVGDPASVVNSNAELILNNCAHYGSLIVNTGSLTLNSTSVISAGDPCTMTSGNVDINNSFVYAGLLVTDTSMSIIDSNVLAITNGIFDYSATSNYNIVRSLIKSENAITLGSTSTVSLNQSTVIGNMFVNNAELNTIYNSIVIGNVTTFPGTIESSNTAYYPEPADIDVTDDIVLSKIPQFKDPDNNDYTPMFGVGSNYEPFELTKDNTDYTLNYEAQTLDGVNTSIKQFSYTTNDIFTFSDYGKEIQFATQFVNLKYDSLTYNMQFYKSVVLTNQIAVSAFPDNGISDTENTWPYEWDLKTYGNSTTSAETYIIPKSIIDITDVINDEFLFDPNTVSVNTLTVNAIKQDNINGITYDYDNSNNNKKIIWTIDDDQNLVKTNVYDGQVLAEYQILSSPRADDRPFLTISGLIPFGLTNTGYKYSLESNPNKLIEGINENFQFKYIPTDVSSDYILGGLIEYKNNLIIVAKYTITDDAVLLVYPSRGTYKDYLILDKEDKYVDPFVINLDNSGLFPSDITVLEDGSFLISDRNSKEVFNYIPQYDYAKLISNNTTDTKILLREQYSNITIEQGD